MGRRAGAWVTALATLSALSACDSAERSVVVSVDAAAPVSSGVVE